MLNRNIRLLADAMSCFDKIKHEVLLKSTSFKEASAFIEKYSDEVYYVEPGYKIFSDCYLIGVKPIALGIKGFDLIFPIVKPRLGTFVSKTKAKQGIKRLREKRHQCPRNKLKANLITQETTAGWFMPYIYRSN